MDISIDPKFSDFFPFVQFNRESSTRVRKSDTEENRGIDLSIMLLAL